MNHITTVCVFMWHYLFVLRIWSQQYVLCDYSHLNLDATGISLFSAQKFETHDLMRNKHNCLRKLIKHISDLTKGDHLS